MTNYTYHMGTPALAAQFVATRCAEQECDRCPVNVAHVDCEDWTALREWLESEVD